MMLYFTRDISKYGPNLKRKLEEHPEIQVIEKCSFTII